MQAVARPHSWLDELLALDSAEVRLHEPLAGHTSFRIGGCAEALVVPKSLEAVELLTKLAAEKNVALTVLGGGTNVLVSDDGVAGIVVDLRPAFDFLLEQEPTERGIRWLIGAGCATARLVTMASARELAGTQTLAGIPGTIGGALVMNAGGHDGDISSLVRRIQLVTQGQTQWWSAEQAQFGYRASKFPRGAVLTAAELELAPNTDSVSIGEQVRARIARRRQSQPLSWPSAGSVFKNPPNDFAARLIEAAGCKGWREGDAVVSELHANFIVNTGSATAAQVARLIARVKDRVSAHSGVQLQLEVRMVGRVEVEAGS